MKDDKNKQNTDDIQIDDEDTSAPKTAYNLNNDQNKQRDTTGGDAEFDDLNDVDAENSDDAEEFVDTDEEGKELGSSAKIKQLRDKLKTAIEEKQQYLNGWQKEKAEFINIRRRDEESKQEFLKFAIQGLLEELLPVLDSFDAATSNKEAWGAVSDQWKAGMETIYGQFKGILSKNGVEAYGEIGDKADPAKFHMIGVDVTEDAKLDHTVSAVLQKGYMHKDKVLRPAMVRIFQV